MYNIRTYVYECVLYVDTLSNIFYNVNVYFFTACLSSPVSSTLPSMTSTLSESSPSTSQTAESSREAPSPTGSECTVRVL